MSVVPIPKDFAGRMTSMARSGDFNNAFAALNQSGLNEDQKAKIAVILKESRLDMQQRISAVVGEGNIVSIAPSLSATQSLPASNDCIATELNEDIVGKLFYHVSQCDLTTLAAIACLNRLWNTCSAKFWAEYDLNKLCPELRVLDAETQGVRCEDEPKISKLRLVKWVREISPHVEGNAGVTQLTMTKGTTLNQLIAIAKGDGMSVGVLWHPTIEELGDVPAEQTYGILITNSVFFKSRLLHCDKQEILVKGHGCMMPTVQEYVALCVFTNKVFKKCLYGQNPSTSERTYGRSSTRVGISCFVVGRSARDCLNVSYYRSAHENHGAGAQRKF
jgi:hypothetical protein